MSDTIHDGYGGRIPVTFATGELIELEDKQPDLLTVAEDAIEVLQEMLADAKVRYLKKYRIEIPDYEESLAILRQSLKETREYQMRMQLQDAEQLEDFA